MKTVRFDAVVSKFYQVKKCQDIMTQETEEFPFVDYENLYSAIMFCCHDGTPISFVLSTKNFRNEMQLRKVIEVIC